MKIVISPAKSLDYESELPTDKATQPRFLEEAETLNNELAQKSKDELKDLMDISQDLADLNYERYQKFSTPFNKDNARPCIYAFDGSAYKELDAYTIDESHIDTLQDSLRILSGMYGILRPLDLMQPYRLEMGTKLQVNGHDRLYDFWGDSLTEALNEELEDDELFVNLASKEYFKALQPDKLKVDVIKPKFKDFKNGKLKTIGFYAKKNRGTMARYLIENEVSSYEGLLGFNGNDYSYSEEHTEDKTIPVFIR
ncbi:MAG: peroxide stress protein YaaA [Aliifodinibius sp.]|nr:peroxide stress protein YaaA [Fodinibius sp.]NIV16657.1 peroxide stress protein YaaA [Fodinibius sp.]NIY30647.1 peroxide stress protein YaaA [Fodinibius sp.]